MKPRVRNPVNQVPTCIRIARKMRLDICPQTGGRSMFCIKKQFDDCCQLFKADTGLRKRICDDCTSYPQEVSFMSGAEIEKIKQGMGL